MLENLNIYYLFFWLIIWSFFFQGLFVLTACFAFKLSSGFTFELSAGFSDSLFLNF